MESNDHQLIVELSKSNFLLRKLYEEHLEYEDQLESLKGNNIITSNDQMAAKRLKKQKLAGVDQMMRIIALHKAA